MSVGREIPAWEGALGASADAAGSAGSRSAVEVVVAPPGWTVRRLGSTGSTNSDLLEAARLGAPDRTVLVAGHQSAGRGRLDRRWEAPPDANVLVSILRCGDEGLRRDGLGDDPGRASRLIALAAVAAAERFTDEAVALKWPNDVLLAGRKLGGILSQRASTGEIVVGLGLNVGWAPEGAARLGPQIDPLDVVLALLAAHDALPGGEPDDLCSRYRARLDTLGRRVRVTLPGREVRGRALDITDDGRLVVLDDCGVTHRLDVGDVVHLRATDE